MRFWKRKKEKSGSESIATPQEVRVERVQLAGRTAFEEVTNIASLARKQNFLLDNLYPIAEASARDFFRKLGVKQPNEYRSGLEVFSSFRSFALSSEGSAVKTWFLTIDSSSRGPDALYLHIEDPVVPIGLAVCKLQKGTFLGHYTTRSEFKDRLGL
jgi:hypothetical protein